MIKSKCTSGAPNDKTVKALRQVADWLIEHAKRILLGGIRCLVVEIPNRKPLITARARHLRRRVMDALRDVPAAA